MAINDVQTLFAKSLDESSLTAKQKAVLRASLTLFSEKGYDHTSTKDIAQAAAVSEGTVYKQFKTKEGILTAILGPFVQQVLPRIATEFLGDVMNTSYPDFADLLRSIVADRLSFALNNRKQLRILAQEMVANAKIIEGFQQQVDRVLPRVFPVIQHYQQQHQLVDWEPSRIARYMISTMMGYVLPVILSDTDTLDVAKASKETTEFLLKGLRP
ncbi:transcriptional regulator [Agrilactobacillus composti DSM 18527 = JCM 14202]|uniref:Transcriptional regulator n=1 Tax=Agrilactobacillus composti DSM 18527 = JCM 14202 TaxID=1423734 RepID=X0PTE2_9LACO|nr:TetR/AcrR family transcriptional regulator [Agrilactobacillus composti]KRM31866.1 transcriptional regulator [Agrilactobacillus composti DSM 18527 = JCM 14202]GAF41277.1 transcriptional regulator, TetR family [Agrilactobacillus composti DSM 18527 = JCM 14202]